MYIYIYICLYIVIHICIYICSFFWLLVICRGCFRVQVCWTFLIAHSFWDVHKRYSSSSNELPTVGSSPAIRSPSFPRKKHVVITDVDSQTLLMEYSLLINVRNPEVGKVFSFGVLSRQEKNTICYHVFILVPSTTSGCLDTLHASCSVFFVSKKSASTWSWFHRRLGFEILRQSSKSWVPMYKLLLKLTFTLSICLFQDVGKPEPENQFFLCVVPISHGNYGSSCIFSPFPSNKKPRGFFHGHDIQWWNDEMYIDVLHCT